MLARTLHLERTLNAFRPITQADAPIERQPISARPLLRAIVEAPHKLLAFVGHRPVGETARSIGRARVTGDRVAIGVAATLDVIEQLTGRAWRENRVAIQAGVECGTILCVPDECAVRMAGTDVGRTSGDNSQQQNGSYGPPNG